MAPPVPEAGLYCPVCDSSDDDYWWYCITCGAWECDECSTPGGGPREYDVTCRAGKDHVGGLWGLTRSGSLFRVAGEDPESPAGETEPRGLGR